MKENKLCVRDMILKSKCYTPQSVRLQEEVAAARADAGRCLVERGEEPRQIVTHSSGNHGQAVAWAAATANLPCTIVVPAGTPSVKVRTAEHGHCQSHNPPGNKNNNHKTES